MDQYDNVLRKQVFSLPSLLKQQYEDLEPKTRKALTTPEIFSIQRIVLTGCGDSLAAAMATKHVFEMLTNIPTEVVTAIELSRFYHEKQLGFSPLNPLVIAVSNSGSGARVGEAIQRARKYGAFTLGVTGNRDSVLGENAHKIIDLEIPDFESAPGTRSYMVSVLALLLLAIRIGEVRGQYTMDQAMDYRYDINTQADALEEQLEDMDQKVFQVAKKWKDLEAYEFVGSGFDYASAWYGHAKIFEATGKYAMHINTEEFLHLNFFQRNTKQIGTVLVSNIENPAHSRSKEVLHYMNLLKRPIMLVTDGTVEDFDEEADYIKVPKTKYPITKPLTHFAPLSLLAGYMAVMIGEEDGRGCKGLWSFAEDGAAVKNSEIIVE